MASFERLNVQRARRPSADGGEGSVWRRFRHPLTFRHKAAPTHVEFSPVAPHDFAVASSLQVDVFSTRTTAIYRSLTRFKDVVHCCSYRGDGKMLAAGDDAGTVQIFDLGSRAVMRTFRGHQRAVHVARFTPDGSNVFTASDDQRAICWDVAAETQVRRFDGHTDFVRCGALNPNSPKLLVTGSYDHTVRLWDVNSPKCIMELQHAAPVEVRAVAFAHGTPHTALLWARGLVCAPLLARVVPRTSCFYPAEACSPPPAATPCPFGTSSAVGVCFRRCVRTPRRSPPSAPTPPARTFCPLPSTTWSRSTSYAVTRCLGRPAERPRTPRAVPAETPPPRPTAQVVGSLKYAAPLLSVALSPASSHLVVGMSDNSLCVRRQATGSRGVDAGGPEARSRSGEASDLQNVGLPGQVAADTSAPLPQDGSTYRYFLRGRNHAPQARPRHTRAAWQARVGAHMHMLQAGHRMLLHRATTVQALTVAASTPPPVPLLLAAGPDGRRTHVSQSPQRVRQGAEELQVPRGFRRGADQRQPRHRGRRHRGTRPAKRPSHRAARPRPAHPGAGGCLSRPSDHGTALCCCAHWRG